MITRFKCNPPRVAYSYRSAVHNPRGNPESKVARVTQQFFSSGFNSRSTHYPSDILRDLHSLHLEFKSHLRGINVSGFPGLRLLGSRAGPRLGELNRKPRCLWDIASCYLTNAWHHLTFIHMTFCYNSRTLLC